MKLIVNLNGDFFCPFQGIIDIAEQLSDLSQPLKQLSLTPICELNTTNDWINLESLGKPVTLRAHMLNEFLSRILAKNAINSLTLHVNVIEGMFTIDNLYVFLFLAASLNELEIIFYSKQEKIELLQQRTTSLQSKINIKLNYKTIDVFSQDNELVIRSEELEIKRYKTLQDAGFIFHPQLLKNTDLSISYSDLLIGYAWACLKAGGEEIGCHVLIKALSQPTLSAPIREKLFMHLQLIRFLSHQYAAVTSESFPDHFNFLETNDVRNIYFIKAYSATLSRNLNVADIYFKKCHIDENMPMTNEASLYQSNLYALFLVLRGEINHAFSLENKIKDHIEKNNIDVMGLKYVNFINIARLYKKMKQFNESLSYYEKAYNEIKDGGYTIYDHIYYNLNLGSLYEVAGETKKSLFHLVKSAIYWLACKNPYALSWRPRLILCQEKITDILMPLSLDKVSQFLYEKINNLIMKATIKLDKPMQTVFYFMLDDANSVVKESCYITENIILYGGQSQQNKQETIAELQLRQLISNIIDQMMNIEYKQNTIIIDTKNENCYAISEEQCLQIALLSGCMNCYYNGNRLNYDTSYVPHLLKKIKISLSKIIHSINATTNGLQLVYKRSFLNKTLYLTDEVDLVKKLLNKEIITVNELQNFPHSTTLFNLIQKNVIIIKEC